MRIPDWKAIDGRLVAAIPVILTALGLWGCLTIYNATWQSGGHFAARQLTWLVLGLGVYVFASNVPFKSYVRHAIILSTASYLLLLAVLFCGVRINGMRGWFDFGAMYFQPSELAKPFFILTLCMVAAGERRPAARYLRMMLLVLLWTAPIMAEPDLGTTMVYLAGFAALYWVSGGRLVMLASTILLALPLLLFYVSQKKYLVGRLMAFADPLSDPLGSGWHICQFRYTLARGGLCGMNWGKAIWANAYLPLSHSDSSFAALVETFGVAGVVPVVLGVLLLVLIAFRLSLAAGGGMTSWLIFSMAVMFAIQSLLHISVNVTLLPPTGITLPIFSYGGSSLVSTMLAFGIVASAARSRTADGGADVADRG